MNKILVVPHCILNTAAKVISYNQEEINTESTNREELLNYVRKNNIQLLQLPCPEFILYGSKRWGHVKDQFNHPFFRKQVRIMLEPIIMQLKEYTSYPEHFQLLGIIAIDGSPSCGYYKTCRGDWGGELAGCPDLHKNINEISMSNEPGVFMEELVSFLEKENLYIPITDLSSFVSIIDL